MPTSFARTRTRSQPVLKPGSRLLGYYQSWNTNTKAWMDPTLHIYINSSAYPPFTEGQSTFDEIHAGPPYRSGGPFKSMRAIVSDPPFGVYGNGMHMHQNGLVKYVGGFHSPQDPDFGSGVSMSTLTPFLINSSLHYPSMDGWGDAAYSKTKPKLEQAGAGVFLAELRDAPRMLRTTSTFFHDLWKGAGGSTTTKIMSPKKTADHFLNHQFGWIPFVSDIGKFYNTFDQSAALISRLAHQNGTYVRKQRTLEEETTEQVLATGTGVKLFPNTSFNGPFFGHGPWFPASTPATWQLHEEIYSRVYAVGRFKYYRPEFDLADPDYMSRINGLKRQLTLYGLRISPSNIYKATPWTWAIDWVSNLGDQIDRANDALVDSVAADYLYVMQHRRIRRVFTQELPFVNGTVRLIFSRVIETKQRSGSSSPYGFNLTLANLTPRQLAIAGALGISRNYR